MGESKDDDDVDGVDDADGVRLGCRVDMLIFNRAWGQFLTRPDGLLQIVGWASLKDVYTLVRFKALRQ